MPLTLNSPIRAEDIDHVVNLDHRSGPDGGVVFLLVGMQGDSIAVKQESGMNRYQGSAAMVRRLGGIASAVDHRSRVVPISVGETRALLEFASAFRKHHKYLLHLNQIGALLHSELPPNAPFEHAKTLKARLLNHTRQWVKMEAREMATLDSAVAAHRFHGRKDPLKRFRKALRDPQGLERLGHIVAADLVTDNFDRFDPREGTTVEIVDGNDSLEIKCEAIVNIGNVIITLDGPEWRPAAMDAVNPYARDRDLAGPMREWQGNLLADAGKRRDYAKRIVKDLDKVLYPHRSKLRKHLGGDATSRLDRGMVEGAGRILAWLDERTRNPATRGEWNTPGIQHRMTVLAQVRWQKR